MGFLYGMDQDGTSKVKSTAWRQTPLTFVDRLNDTLLAASSYSAIDIIHGETGRIIHVFETRRNIKRRD